MRDRLEDLASRLDDIDDELRDLAYDRLADAVRDPTAPAAAAARATEKRLLQARRAVARAAEALRAATTTDEGRGGAGD